MHTLALTIIALKIYLSVYPIWQSSMIYIYYIKYSTKIHILFIYIYIYHCVFPITFCCCNLQPCYDNTTSAQKRRVVAKVTRACTHANTHTGTSRKPSSCTCGNNCCDLQFHLFWLLSTNSNILSHWNWGSHLTDMELKGAKSEQKPTATKQQNFWFVTVLLLLY